jgi:1,4-alpha-glucan branching enzyme
MSGMPGMTVKVEEGGIGFDYRLAMGLPDMWIKQVLWAKDEDWGLAYIWHELTARMAATIAYVESHDQALVGDKTLIFRLADAAMYTDMDKACHTMVIDRAIALHKIIRLLTIAGGGDGYLNFMGNQFGHPEWIDFPREGNGWSFHYCRRQWSLVDNGYLKYECLNEFDRDMVELTKKYRIFDQTFGQLQWVHYTDHTLVFARGGLVFAFNFHPTQSFEDYMVPVPEFKDYEVVLSSDDDKYNGQDRIAHVRRSSFIGGVEGPHVKLYLPCRTAVALLKVEW